MAEGWGRGVFPAVSVTIQRFVVDDRAVKHENLPLLKFLLSLRHRTLLLFSSAILLSLRHRNLRNLPPLKSFPKTEDSFSFLLKSSFLSCFRSA